MDKKQADAVRQLAGQLGGHLGVKVGEAVRSPEQRRRTEAGEGIQLLRVDRNKPDPLLEAFKPKP
jgi:hypothetical protein